MEQLPNEALEDYCTRRSGVELVDGVSHLPALVGLIHSGP